MSNLNSILLQPTDILFFRDGRPMSGSLAGHTSAWPLPDVTNHALHAALHRAGLEGVHKHVPGRSSQQRDHSDENRNANGRMFGSLLTAGPFPVNATGQWFFPRPRDAQLNGSVEVSLQPARSLSKDGNDDPWLCSSLPEPLEYAVANTAPASKEAGGEPWISAKAFAAYLRGQTAREPDNYLRDANLADTEHQIGIGIDPETQTQDKTNFYSAHYLRLREGFRLGILAEAKDKSFKPHNGDLIKALLNGHPEQIIVGGQQRICTASRSDTAGPLPLPRGLNAQTDFTLLSNKKFAVKWVLLTPAIWPAIQGSTSKVGEPINAHPGGWLPNWVCPATGSVLLKSGDTERGEREGREVWRARVRQLPVTGTRLVAAIVPKPISVTGWALANGTDRPVGGAKSTHLAVPAGAVYYFEADSAKEATKLAVALNWHGSDMNLATIKNRRSTLMGEKGFGLGVCGTWTFLGT